ncbi:hypothetical protein VKT23_007767 [Stygiomarasmius scandens]|uniref:Uncharacterized protein n=1 Tax=Marasmiellus scandens TaxID=2682957 RepID=A0ABR1JIC8_9AGAR
MAPELIILWAMRQWITSQRIAKKYKAYGWTKVHGHFLAMGGLIFIDQNGDEHIIDDDICFDRENGRIVTEDPEQQLSAEVSTEKVLSSTKV